MNYNIFVRNILSNKVLLGIFIYFITYYQFNNINIAIFIAVSIIVILHYANYFCIMEPFRTEEYRYI